MSDDLLKKIDLRRAIYRENMNPNSSEIVRTLQEIKSELKVQTDIEAMKEEEQGVKSQSPYLPDQVFYDPKVVFRSPQETQWKEVKSYEEVRQNYPYKSIT